MPAEIIKANMKGTDSLSGQVVYIFSICLSAQQPSMLLTLLCKWGNPSGNGINIFSQVVKVFVGRHSKGSFLFLFVSSCSNVWTSKWLVGVDTPVVLEWLVCRPVESHKVWNSRLVCRGTTRNAVKSSAESSFVTLAVASWPSSVQGRYSEARKITLFLIVHVYYSLAAICNVGGCW